MSHSMERRALEEAIEWVVRMYNGPMSVATRSEFADWLLASPANVQALLEVAQTIGGISAATAGMDAEELVMRASEEGKLSNVVPLGVAPRSAQPKPKPLSSPMTNRALWLIVAAVIAATLAGSTIGCLLCR